MLQKLCISHDMTRIQVFQGIVNSPTNVIAKRNTSLDSHVGYIAVGEDSADSQRIYGQ
jgi:hypothetical protein